MRSTDAPGAGSGRLARIARASGAGALLLVGAWAGAGGVARIAIASPAGGSGWGLLALFAVTLVATYWVWRGETTARTEVLRFALTWPALYLACCGQFLLFPGVRPAVWLFPQRVAAADYAAGWRLLLAGGAIFAVVAALASRGASTGIDPPTVREIADPKPGTRAGVVRLCRAALIAVALAAYVYNLGPGKAASESPRSVGLWLLSVVLLLVSQAKLPVLRRPVPEAAAEETSVGSGRAGRWLIAAALAAVLAVAIGVRTFDLARLPLDVHGDSASIGLGAREILDGRVPDLFSTGWAALPWRTFLPGAITLRLVSNDLVGLSASGVLAGVAAVLACYLLGAFLFGRPAGVAVAMVAATSHVAIHFSRMPQYMDPVPFVLFGLYWLLRGLHSGGGRWFVLAGTALATSFTLYYSGRIGLVLAAVAVAYVFVFEPRRVLRAWRGLVLFVVALIVTYGPSLRDNLEHPHEFLDRTRQVWLFDPGVMAHSMSKYNVSSVEEVVLEQARRTVLMFNHVIDSSTQFGFPGPFVHPYLAPLLLLGAVVGVVRLRRPYWLLPVLWLLVAMTLGSLLTLDAPFWPRLVLLVGPCALLVVVGLLEVLASLAAPLPRARWVAVAGAVLAVGFLSFVGLHTWNWYRRDSGSYVGDRTWLARVIAATPPAEGFCMIQGPFSFRDREFEFLLAGRAVEDYPMTELSAGLDRCGAIGRTWALYLPEHQQALDALQRRWPAGTSEAHPMPRGERGPTFWRPPTGAGPGGAR